MSELITQRDIPWLGVLVAALCSSSARAQVPELETPQNMRSAERALASAPQTVITNGLIKATVLLPDRRRGFYQGSRFDWSGMISSLTVHKVEYYGPWFDRLADGLRDFIFDQGSIVAGPASAAVGPAEVFDAATEAGWSEAQAGGGFLKIGVGLLRKPADLPSYNQFRAYEVLDPGIWTVARRPNKVDFVHRLRPTLSGFGYTYRKTLILVPGKPMLRIEHSLMNNGRWPIITSVYNHNFLTIGAGHERAGLKVQLSFPVTTTRPLATDAAAVEGRAIGYLRGLNDKEVLSSPITGFGTGAEDNRFLIGTAYGAEVEIKGDRPLSRLQLWSVRSTVAIEPSIRISVAPGETFKWSYSYVYRSAKPPPPW